MDRPLLYPAAIPLASDGMLGARYAQVGVGRLGDMLYGTTDAAAYGLAWTASTTALTVTIGVGSILNQGVVDATAPAGTGSGMAADSTPITCQYLNESAQTVTIPGTGATYTIYALCVDSDTDNTVLPFFNASNPSQTQSGQSNSGATLPTRRTSSMTFVASVTAPSAPTNGSVVPLYAVVVPAGATSASAATFSVVSPSPFNPTIPELATLVALQAAVANFAQMIQYATAPLSLVLANVTVPVPSWATRIEIEAVGGGGGGAGCYGSSVAGSVYGGGGGAGAACRGTWYVSPGNQIGFTIGAGGPGGIGSSEQVSSQAGGATSVTVNGTQIINLGGGQGGDWYTSDGCAGGQGGTASVSGSMQAPVGPWGGGYGSDGQSSSAEGFGNGAPSIYGGNGRAGSGQGEPATAYGAGGGGAYDPGMTGVIKTGGAGMQGAVYYRFLP